MPIDSAYKGCVAVGPRSIFSAWAFELLRAAAAATSPPLQVRPLDRLDEAGAAGTWPKSLYLVQSPGAAALSIIENGQMPVVAFLDEACDTIAYMRRCSGGTLIATLQEATSGAVANPGLFRGKASLVIRRGSSGNGGELIDRVFAHLKLRLPGQALAAIKKKHCGAAAGNSSLESCLQTVASYKPPGDWSKELSAEEAKVAEQALTPLIQMAKQDSVPIRWPRSVFRCLDRPNDPVPIVANMMGAARYIYFGPYLHLPPGTYRVRLVIGFSKTAVGTPFTADVYSSEVLAKAQFRPTGQGVFRGDFFMVHSRPQDVLEVRIRTDEGSIDGQFGLAWVEFTRIGDVGEQLAAAILEHQHRGAILTHNICGVYGHDHAAVAAPLEDFAVALFLKPGVADDDHLIDQNAFEIDRQRQRESQTHAHATGIEPDQLVQLVAELGKVFHILVGFLERHVVHS
jgi:hypothetical protein